MKGPPYGIIHSNELKLLIHKAVVLDIINVNGSTPFHEKLTDVFCKGGMSPARIFLF